MNHRFQAIVFDLDGTLIDTAPDLTAALNHVLTASGRPALPASEVRSMIGDGVVALLRRGLAAAGPPVDDASFAAMHRQYLDYYSAHIADRSTPFVGVGPVLVKFRDEGRKLGICTNKPIALTQSLLRTMELTEFFPVVLGGDSLAVKKPDPEHLNAVLKRLGVPPERAAMIGDSRNDAATARAAGVACVLVSFGYTAVPARELGAEAVIDDFRDLPRALERLS
ncbi:MAG: phosphoglycolate phosphatase [Alphaproteobacteria bacterium]|nr:phosphoglycolate phosphatase [Alphaproteobacteria bacterium]